MPLLDKHKLKWCISGGFACYLYDVDRPIEAIDLDVEADKDDPEFQGLIEDVKPYTELPFQLWIDNNYDNWVMDVVVDDQLLSICDTKHLKLFNKETGNSELFYPEGKIPEPVMMEFESMQLPIAPKESVLRMRQAIPFPKEAEVKDIEGMERIIKNS